MRTPSWTPETSGSAEQFAGECRNEQGARSAGGGQPDPLDQMSALAQRRAGIRCARAYDHWSPLSWGWRAVLTRIKPGLVDILASGRRERDVRACMPARSTAFPTSLNFPASRLSYLKAFI